MASSRLEGRSYGQRSPPLTHILRSILERYPDGGQILKEIIQNADDAGATKVSFLLDSRPGFYGKNSLYNPSLAKFQGPALYAQNDALFEESDWENLERLMQSNKKNDPLKVGRFGIGFSSVYHMTDLPSVVSGDAIAFLDPHEVHFDRNETGKMFSLKDRPLREHRDQFLPYEDVLDCKISTQFYNGTLFRFPLRNEPSDLSKKNYTPEKVRQLFDALQKEASVILLFLKNIEEIALFETDQSNTRKRIFTVRLSGSCRQKIHKAKKSFLTQVKRLRDGKITNTNLSLALSFDEIDKRGGVVTRRWLVHHEIDARDSGLRQLSLELGLLPWIGMATPLDGTQRQRLSSSGGRIFCFLPLPPDADAKTGLPVHVHGYFGLTDNRRGLKWPGLDCQNDCTAEWNVMLLEEVGGQAYASMLLNLTEKLAREPGDPSEKAHLAYLSWPTIQEVQSHWKRLLKPMFAILSSEKVFWTPADGGKWLRHEDVYLDRITDSNEIKSAVLESLAQADEPVVTLPDHVMNVIDSMSWSTDSITPGYLRNLLKLKRRGSWDIQALPKKKKLCLLEYVLQDEDVHDMEGVPLLPLANGKFVEFRSLKYNRDPSAAVYVSSTRYSRSLFPNMENRFLDDSISSTAFQYLSSIASHGRKLQARRPVQLVQINQDIAMKLMRENLPAEWSGSGHFVYWSPGQNGHPPESWLKCVWSWIRRDFFGDLSNLMDLPLIPHASCGRRTLVKLRTSSLAIRDGVQGVSLPANVLSTLTKLGCIVLEKVPSYVDHPYLHNYIASPNPCGVLKVLQILGQSTCAIEISSSCTKDEKQALRGFLSSTVLNHDQQCILLCLPIFNAIDGRSFLAAKDRFQYRTVAPFGFQLPGGLPIPNASNIVFLGDTQSKDLLHGLGLTEMHPTALLSSVVFSGVKNGFYTHHQISTLMCWVLRQYNYMQNSTFSETVRQLQFVVTQSNRLVAPCEVLDPKKSVLLQLFEGNSDKFPHNDFMEGDTLQMLQQLGMKTFPNTQDILEVAQTLENVVDALASRKASALLEFLDSNSYLLKTDRTLLQGLLSKRWVRRKEDPPHTYPKAMPWFKKKRRYYNPREVVSQSKANIVGATMPLAWKPCSTALETAFGWPNSPPLHHVLAQLRSACSLALEATPSTEKLRFEKMLRDIYQELSVNMEATTKLITDDLSFPAWIWHGNGFTSPNKAAFSQSGSFSLNPYRYLIPNDFNNFRPLFTRSGVRATFDDADLLDVLELIKEKHETEGVTKDATADQKLAHDILHWIVREDKPLNPELRQRLLVPVITRNKMLKLVLCSKCTFCDANWLKKGGHHFPGTSQFPMIHDTISTKIATLLGVPPISTRITCAEALGIEQTGPHEPVTTRLKNILNEYKEGVAVFKELVQNADDAGATEVRFVLDWRSHPTEKLLAPGMADCQGPALLLYNNAVFSDDDLINISRLAGATKKEDLKKIGRFGLGFSSVYHFTDVPSFITRNYAVFFDPHTKYLQHQIRDSSKPGIKLDFAINPNNLSFSDQFAPFNGMFGCDTSLPQESKKFFFQGTLFRFPFRTKLGEISDKIYSRQEIQDIVRSFRESSSSLLLFTQNLYGEEHKFVAGSSWSILDESCSSGCGRLNEKTRSLFGFDVREPTVDEVCFQLNQAIDAAIHSDAEAQCLQSVCHSIYKYLQERLTDYTTEIVLEELAQRPWIFIQQKFVSSSQVAFDWNGIGDPYLYQVPNELAANFRPLFQATGVRDHFCAKDFIRTMYEFEKAKRGRPLHRREFKVIRCLIDELLGVPKRVLKREDGTIPLPDHHLVLQAARELAINDAPWVTSGIDTRYVHKDVAIDLAHRMGAVDIRSRKLAKISRPIGQEFGQREELTDRLKGILKSYPCDVGILKELVQNADDAGATEIHFIYDPRTHAGDRLLSENWKELQGPALCVYNNRPFSEEDLEGIQRLGIGSKTEDPTKTGQYGIGFNAVYHLTDCPSFISNGDTLCILDPHCRYAPGATKRSPGRLIKPIAKEERSDYRDTFPGYLEDHFDLTMSTMFRFPLRKKNMPTTSLISEEYVSHEQMTKFMDLFTSDAEEILLFLNHLKKITLSKIKNGRLRQIYSVSADVSDEDAVLRGQLSDHLKSSKRLETNEIQWFGITYPLRIQDSFRKEKWLVHQSIGLKPCDATDEVPNGQPFGLLPRVGIAAKVWERKSSHTEVRTTPQYKAFCFLPLPLKTGLPVHVNGHFYLDSARRNLWYDEKDEGFGSQWNNFMKKKVLPEAYVSLLLEARLFVPGSTNVEEPHVFKTYQIHDGLCWYQGLFPHFSSVDSKWTILVSSLFSRIYHHDKQLLPLLKRATAGNVPGTSTGHSKGPNSCFWLSPSQGFFNTIPTSNESDQKRCKILLQIGFNLLYSKKKLFDDFKKADTNVREITPEAVTQFLREGATNIGTLPCPVKETAIGSVLGVVDMLRYCMKSTNFATVMSELPLLLTEDGVLRCFQEAEPVFLSRFYDLVPHKSSLFIHHAISEPLFLIEENISATNQRVLKKFDIPALALLLPETKHDSWYEANNLIPWDKNKWPSQEWLQLLWKFIYDIYLEDRNKFSLNPLDQWPVVPTLSGMLSPVSKGKVILDLTSEETWSAGQRKVVRLLRKLGCHEVDAKLMDGTGVRNLSPILKPYLSQPNSCEDVLRVLDHQLKEKNISCILSEDEVVVILQFLQEEVDSVRGSPWLSSIIRRLPFFKTFHGRFVSLENVPSIYVIPTGLPTEESEVWMTGNQCVFLAPQPNLDCLYREILRARDITHTDCYIKFIFPKFPYLKQTTRMLHLEYVRGQLLVPHADKNNRSRVINSMRTLAFIPDAFGKPYMASEFCDPSVTVFAVMLPRESKPPKPFDDCYWLRLLREIGLKQKVSKNQFQTFANEVATQAELANKFSRPTLEGNSKVLVTYLLKETSLHDEKFLDDLSTVKFVASQKASNELILLHNQYLVENGSQDPPFIPFKDSVVSTEENERLVWTSASLLPSWAIPDLDCYPELARLKVLFKPSLDQVTENVKRVSTNVSKSADRERPELTRSLLRKVMINVYSFLTETCGCSSNEVSDSCSKACVKIESFLSSIACALVEDGRIFVRCDQLAYNLKQELAPYLYRVPREYGAFEHLFKRLGAMETATPEQFAKLLSRLKESCGKEKMLANELTAAKHASTEISVRCAALSARS
ncbi:PREDICTED: sacsin-like [Acropora digitifera]|uniref:sacsin-like n=1 Tax=Acropora digitifera TaxID=70779 RepID=UPI00077A8EBA|nr:PREDICTED: sacsin-like [Acropora digitifera]